jgi:4-hydroxythreonine-4-phosphate dehydrogenase
MTAVIDAPADLAAVPPGCLPVLVPPGLPAGLATCPGGASTPATARRRPLHRTRCAGCGRRGPAIVTAPIHKEALAAAGVPFPGHTEMLQAWPPTRCSPCRRCA